MSFSEKTNLIGWLRNLAVGGSFATAALAAGCEQPGPHGSSQAITGESEIVIAQVYGAGGSSSSATYNQDFVVLFNRSSHDVPLTSMSLQYASSAGTFGASASQIAALPSVTLPPGRSFLVAMATGSSGGGPLPTADFSAVGVNMAGGTGKIALALGTTSLGCGMAGARCTPTASILLDMVGYGTSASDYEGTGPAPQAGAELSVRRFDNGCRDTNDNASDLEAVVPVARNSTMGDTPCPATTDAGAGASDGGDAMDAGSAAATDGGSVVAPEDAGATPGSDAGGGGSDAGTPSEDAGSPVMDAGVAPADAGVTTPDAGPDVDAAVERGGILLNEVRLNPPGADDGYELIELVGPAGATIPTNTYVLSVESDDATGTIHYAFDLSGRTLGANGLLLIKSSCVGYPDADAATTVISDANLNTGRLQNGSEAVVLVTTSAAATIEVGTTQYSSLPSPTLLDGVASIDNVSEHSSVARVPEARLAASGGPDALSRVVGDDRRNTLAAWFFGDLRTMTGVPGDPATVAYIEDATRLSPGFPAGGRVTPGAANTLTGPDGRAELDPSCATAPDAGVELADAGTPDTDAGFVGRDAGPVGRDAGGVVEQDAGGTVTADAGLIPRTDAGGAARDGSVGRDAGTGGGTGGGDDSGCSCSVPSSSSPRHSGRALLVLGLATLVSTLRIKRSRATRRAQRRAPRP